MSLEKNELPHRQYTQAMCRLLGGNLGIVFLIPQHAAYCISNFKLNYFYRISFDTGKTCVSKFHFDTNEFLKDGTSDSKYKFTVTKKSDCIQYWRADGRCGSQYPLPDGRPGQCDPNGNGPRKGPCCSMSKYCGNSDAHCKCSGCLDFSGKHILVPAYLPATYCNIKTATTVQIDYQAVVLADVLSVPCCTTLTLLNIRSKLPLGNWNHWNITL